MSDRKSLDICVLGFGNISRALIDKIKRFPDYGLGAQENFRIHIHMVYVNRETWGYGPELVVPVIDAQGNASRTYKDGLEAIRRYETTVSWYRDWLLEKISNPRELNTVIDCTSYNFDSLLLMKQLLANCAPGTTFYTTNTFLVEHHLEELLLIAEEKQITFNYRYALLEDADEVVEELIKDLRIQHDGGKSWTPVQFSEEFLAEAAELSREAAKASAEWYTKDQYKIVNSCIEKGFEFAPDDLCVSNEFLDDTDVKVIKRFVVNGEGSFKRTERYNAKDKCRVITHEMLDWFFGKIGVLPLSAQMFLIPDLKILGAKCFVYDSPDSKSSVVELQNDCEYAISVMVDVENPWPRYYVNVPQNVAAPPKFAIGYGKAIGPSYRKKLGTTDNDHAIILSYHLGRNSSECKCYDV